MPVVSAHFRSLFKSNSDTDLPITGRQTQSLEITSHLADLRCRRRAAEKQTKDIKLQRQKSRLDALRRERRHQ